MLQTPKNGMCILDSKVETIENVLKETLDAIICSTTLTNIMINGRIELLSTILVMIVDLEILKFQMFLQWY